MVLRQFSKDPNDNYIPQEKFATRNTECCRAQIEDIFMYDTGVVRPVGLLQLFDRRYTRKICISRCLSACLKGD